MLIFLIFIVNDLSSFVNSILWNMPTKLSLDETISQSDYSKLQNIDIDKICQYCLIEKHQYLERLPSEIRFAQI